MVIYSVSPFGHFSTTMTKVFSFLKPYTLLIVILIVMTVAQVAANLALPDFTAKIINEGIVSGNQDIIAGTGLEMLLIALLGGLFTVVAGYLASRVASGFARDLRSRLFAKIESFSLAEFNQFSASSLITRSTNDIQQIQTVLVIILRMVLSAPITAVWAVAKAVDNAPSMSWIMALAVITLLALIITIFTLAIPKFQKVQTLTDKLNQVVRESLTGIRVIRALNNQNTERKRLLDVNTDLTNTNLFVNRITAVMQPMMFLIMNLATIGIVWVGSHLILDNQIGIGNMLAFMQYAIQVIIAFLMISIVFIMLPRALVSARRVSEVLNTDPRILDHKYNKNSKEKRGVIEFKDVTFGYNQADEPVLENISFIARPGQTTAFIGSTGSGKSTLINLIPRFYDTTFGEILIDGVDIKDITQAELREQISYVSQKPVLFSGTIASNIKYGTESATDEQMMNAAQIAQAAEFIEKMPEKYATPVSQNGANLSGGQKQRISIARAIVKDPHIFIFDDSFSALDFKTDAKLRKALAKHTKDKTVLIVAQRINTIMHADQIIVLDSGNIVGRGTHTELMQSCQVYQEIARSQLSEAELNKAKK